MVEEVEVVLGDLFVVVLGCEGLKVALEAFHLGEEMEELTLLL